MKWNCCLLLIVFFLSCHSPNTELLKGDLYFKLIAFPSLYGSSETEIENFEKYLDSLKSNETASPQEKELVSYFKKLEELNLLKSPNIKVIDEKGEIRTVFLNENEFEKIEKYTIDYLRENNKKVTLEIEAKVLDTEIYYSDDIKTIQESNGETLSSK